MSGVTNYRHARTSRSPSQRGSPESTRKAETCFAMSSGLSLETQPDPALLCLLPLAYVLPPYVEHAHLSPPLYLRDDGKSQGSGARLVDSSTASINDSYVSLPWGPNHASVPHVQDRIKEDLIERLL